VTVVLASFTILGEAVSKANSRVRSTIGPKDKRRVIIRKSEKALSFEEGALRQIPPMSRVRFDGPVSVTLKLFYASERPDLDESIVLDVMQDRWKRDKLTGERVLLQHGVYRNDRQVREKHVYHGYDPRNPRCEVRVSALQVQTSLDMAPEKERDAFGEIP